MENHNVGTISPPSPESQTSECPASMLQLTDEEVSPSYHSTDLATIYRAQVKQVPSLTEAQEISIDEAIAAGRMHLRQPDTVLSKSDQHIADTAKQARNELVQVNLGLVLLLAGKKLGRGLEFLDLVQAGNRGLIKAAENFERSQGNRFSTYAVWWIEAEIKLEIAGHARNIRLPKEVFYKEQRLYRTSQDLLRKLGRKPTIEETAAAMKMPVEEAAALARVPRDTISLDAPVASDTEDTLRDILTTRTARTNETPEDQVVKAITRNTIRKGFDAIFQALLTDEERSVIRLRYGFEKDMGGVRSYSEINRMCKRHAAWAKRREDSALEKLRSEQGRWLIQLLLQD